MKTTGRTRRGFRAVAAGVAITVCGAMLSGLGPAPEAAAALRGCQTDGAYEVCFSDPVAYGADDPVIVNRLQELINSADSDDLVLIAMYEWSQTGIAADVVKAKQRGVNIQLVIDDVSSDMPAYATLRDGLGSYFYPCSAGCISGEGINHNKFFLFNIDGVKSVVQTSTNLTTGMQKHANNMVKVTGDANLYTFYYQYWHRLRAKSWTYSDAGGTWTDEDKRAAGSLGTVGYAFPRDDTDPLLSILRNVTACTGPRQGRIWLSQSKVSQSARAEDIRQELSKLETAGCDVKIVVLRDFPESGDGRSTEEWLEDSANGHDLEDTKVREAKVHHKFTLIDAEYVGEWARYVVTGSHNITWPSLQQNDEAMMRIRNPFVFEQFEQHFRGLYTTADT